MNWFNNRKTATKLICSFGLIMLLLAAVIAAGLRGIDAIDRSADQALALSRIESNHNRSRASVLALLDSGDAAAQASATADLQEAAAESDSLLQQVLTLAEADPTLRDRMDDFAAQRSDYTQGRAQVLDLVGQGRHDEAQALSLGMQQQRYLRLRDLSRELSDAASSAQVAQHRLIERSALVIGITALLLAAAIIFLLQRSIARPLGQVARLAERVAAGEFPDTRNLPTRGDEVGLLLAAFVRMIAALQRTADAARRIADGDLRESIVPRSEHDVLGQAFAAMGDNLRRLNLELVDGIEVLSAAAGEISASTSQFAGSAAETATAVIETTTTVEEVRQTAEVSSQKAKLVSDTAQRMAQAAETGHNATADMVAGMGRIQQQMEAIAASMRRLSEQSLAVGQIVTAVEDLAVQSKLLAVNASIEAAKAGEQGKGFGVVAQEVKSLAEQSRQATSQVRELLGEMQKATSAAVLATEQGGQAVDAGVAKSHEAGQAILTLAGGVSAAAQAALLIAASSQQQLVGVDQVAQAMSGIRLASTQNVDSARQLETSAHSLKTLGERLRLASERYRLSA